MGLQAFSVSAADDYKLVRLRTQEMIIASEAQNVRIVELRTVVTGRLVGETSLCRVTDFCDIAQLCVPALV